jgi:hypothetical protein
MYLNAELRVEEQVLRFRGPRGNAAQGPCIGCDRAGIQAGRRVRLSFSDSSRKVLRHFEWGCSSRDYRS